MRLISIPPGTRGTIQLRLPHRTLQRWHHVLAETLVTHGYSVRIDYVDAYLPEVSGLSILKFIDQTLSRGPLPDEPDLSAPMGALSFGSFVASTPQRLVIDCTAAPLAGGELPVLVPDFDGFGDARGLLAALLDGRSPRIGWRRLADGALVRHGEVAIAHRHLISRCFNQSLGRLVSMATAAVRLAQDSGAQIEPTATVLRGTGAVARHALSQLSARVMRRVSRQLASGAQWNIGWRHAAHGAGVLASASLPAEAFRWLPRNPAGYVADPFPFQHAGKTWLFCEEFPYATGKGRIAVSECAEDGTPGPFRPVLETGYHLSYPAVFERDGQIFMIPETTGNRSVELYRAERFPDTWVLHTVLAEDVSWADATLFDHGGRVWLAAATTDCGGTDRDALSLFHASRFGDRFEAHPLNPVLVDVRGARPAGWLERDAGGKWLRPAQDCSGGYGWGLRISRIDRLDRETFSETVLASIPPPASLGAKGLHTVNRAGTFEAIDAIL